MNWNQGFSARYYMTLVEPRTWRDVQRYEITGGSVSRAAGSLMEAADIDMTDAPQSESWIRIYLDARQNDIGTREALFTGLLSTPATQWDGSRRSYRAECYSVLQPAADVLLQRGWYAPAGMNGAKLIAELLSCGPAPVSYADNSPILSATIVAEDQETNLTMAQRIMEAIGWRIRITGMGEINVIPKATEPAVIFDAFENDSIEMAITDAFDRFKCPNVFRATYNDMSAVARDDDPESPLSTVVRGREIWMQESVSLMSENENIAEYALRRLKEEQSPARSVQYTRRYRPDITVGDIICLHHPAQGIDGNFLVKSQKIELGYGGRTTEEAEWQT